MESPSLDHAARFLANPRFLFGCVIIVSLVRFVNLGFPDLQAWDEGVYALRSASIVHFGDWLDQTPHVPGGLTISCHPPLTFWTSAVLYEVFGASEWTTRCTSAFFGAGGVLLIVYCARRLASTGTGLYAGLLFGTNLFYTFYSRQGQLDVAYVFFLLLALFGWTVWLGGSRWKGLGLVALGTWGAFMSKILVGFYVPLILLSAQSIQMRHRWQWRGVLDLCAAIAVGVVLASPWYVFMFLRYGHSFTDVVFGLHLMQRVSSPLEGHDPLLGGFFYINQILVHYPEALLAAGLLVLLVRRKVDPATGAGQLILVSVVWSVVVLAIITIMATKIPQYLLPISVPVALLGGLSLSLLAEHKITRRSQIVLVTLLSAATLWSALWPLRAFIRGSLLGIATAHPYMTIQWGMVVVALVCVLYCLYLFLSHRRNRSEDRARIFVGVLLLVLIGRVAWEVGVADGMQYNVGTREVASFLREEHAQRVIYLGKDLNSALDIYLKDWDQWRTDIRLEHHLCEATVMTPAGRDIDFPRPNEVTFLVEENRIANQECYPALAVLKDHHPVLFSNRSYQVYNLTGQ